MLRSVLVAGLAATLWSAPPVTAQPAKPANPAEDATKFVTTIIDKFNAGDTKSWLAAQENSTMIVDEFGPHTWNGPGSAQRWLDDYAKDAAANGTSGGRVDYGKALQATSDGTSAYIVLPTTYRFVEKGTKMAEAGSMTFVVKRESDGWKITSWTWSARGDAAPEK